MYLHRTDLVLLKLKEVEVLHFELLNDNYRIAGSIFDLTQTLDTLKVTIVFCRYIVLE